MTRGNETERLKMNHIDDSQKMSWQPIEKREKRKKGKVARGKNLKIKKERCLFQRVIEKETASVAAAAPTGTFGTK